jgi:sodium pump decarboxylase gamma subunit
MENLLESVILLVVGMGGVFAALLLLAGMIWLFKAADDRLNHRRIRKYSETVESAQGVEDVNDEVVAVLSAAAAAVLKKPVRVRRIRFLTTGPAATWAVTGRLNVMASHQISRRKS